VAQSDGNLHGDIMPDSLHADTRGYQISAAAIARVDQRGRAK